MEPRNCCRTLLAMLLFVSIYISMGCQSVDGALGGVAHLPHSIDDVGQVIKDGIGKLEKESGKWRTTLEETRDKMIAIEDKVVKDGQSTISNEINNILQRAIAATGADARCSQEFIGDQVRRELERLLLGEERDPTPLPPSVCQAVPGSIDLDLLPSRRTKYRVKTRWDMSIAIYLLSSSSLTVFILHCVSI